MALMHINTRNTITAILTLFSVMAYSQTIKVYGCRMHQMGAVPVNMKSIKERYNYYADVFDKKIYDNTYSIFNKNNRINTGTNFDANANTDAAVIRIDFTDDSCGKNGETCSVILFESGKFISTDGNLYPLNRTLYKQIKKLVLPASRPHMLLKWHFYKKKLRNN